MRQHCRASVTHRRSRRDSCRWPSTRERPRNADPSQMSRSNRRRLLPLLHFANGRPERGPFAKCSSEFRTGRRYERREGAATGNGTGPAAHRRIASFRCVAVLPRALCPLQPCPSTAAAGRAVHRFSYVHNGRQPPLCTSSIASRPAPPQSVYIVCRPHPIQFLKHRHRLTSQQSRNRPRRSPRRTEQKPSLPAHPR
jgi:hypothetical protein